MMMKKVLYVTIDISTDEMKQMNETNEWMLSIYHKNINARIQFNQTMQ